MLSSQHASCLLEAKNNKSKIIGIIALNVKDSFIFFGIVLA